MAEPKDPYKTLEAFRKKEDGRLQELIDKAALFKKKETKPD